LINSPFLLRSVESARAAQQAALATEERLRQSLADRLTRQKDALRLEMETRITSVREDERRIAEEERTERVANLRALQETLNDVNQAMFTLEQVFSFIHSFKPRHFLTLCFPPPEKKL